MCVWGGVGVLTLHCDCSTKLYILITSIWPSLHSRVTSAGGAGKFVIVPTAALDTALEPPLLEKAQTRFSVPCEET